MSITSLVRPIFRKKYKRLLRSEQCADDEQRALLQSMVRKAQRTEWGCQYDFASIKSYEDFRSRVPVTTYEELKGFIDRMRHGEKDVLWPGTVKWYAKSS
ncbi:MAG: GH3 auxin-responsive promoter family protein, partial [Bacteroidaceae bacterium]|nr:GH3 auxin-responsive promoter family protein [Bacteroidaceae bacterium]